MYTINSISIHIYDLNTRVPAIPPAYITTGIDYSPVGYLRVVQVYTINSVYDGITVFEERCKARAWHAFREYFQENEMNTAVLL